MDANQAQSLEKILNDCLQRLKEPWTPTTTAQTLLEMCADTYYDRAKACLILSWVCLAVPRGTTTLRAHQVLNAVKERRIEFADAGLRDAVVGTVCALNFFINEDPVEKYKSYSFTEREEREAGLRASQQEHLQVVAELMVTLSDYRQFLLDNRETAPDHDQEAAGSQASSSSRNDDDDDGRTMHHDAGSSIVPPAGDESAVVGEKVAERGLPQTAEPTAKPGLALKPMPQLSEIIVADSSIDPLSKKRKNPDSATGASSRRSRPATTVKSSRLGKH
jgi:hypothetical protein